MGTPRFTSQDVQLASSSNVKLLLAELKNAALLRATKFPSMVVKMHILI